MGRHPPDKHSLQMVEQRLLNLGPKSVGWAGATGKKRVEVLRDIDSRLRDLADIFLDARKA